MRFTAVRTPSNVTCAKCVVTRTVEPTCGRDVRSCGVATPAAGGTGRARRGMTGEARACGGDVGRKPDDDGIITAVAAMLIVLLLR